MPRRSLLITLLAIAAVSLFRAFSGRAQMDPTRGHRGMDGMGLA